MARGRGPGRGRGRGPGRTPPGLGSALGSLVRNTIEQMGAVREVVERSTQQQRGWFDAARMQRQRREVLAELGERVYDLAARGRLGALADQRGIRAYLEEIDELDQQLAATEQRSQHSGEERGFARESGWPKERTKPKAARTRQAEEDSELRVWRPVSSTAAPEGDAMDLNGLARLAETDLHDQEPESQDAEPEPSRRGGITFGNDWDDDENDLEEYMCPGDIPVDDQQQLAGDDGDDDDASDGDDDADDASIASDGVDNEPRPGSQRRRPPRNR